MAAAACPGRTAALVEARVAQVLSAPIAVDDDIALVARTRQGATPAESALLDVVEVFVADVHAVDDEVFDTLRPWFTEPEIVAVLMHAGLCDGFARWSLAEVG
jgi:alkylhydroperoxidase family enzyme